MQDYPNADKRVAELAKELWGADNEKVRKVGKGQVYAGETSLDEIFKSLNIVPDCNMSSTPKTPVKFIHRQLPEGDIYFLSNQSKETQRVTPEFRVAGRAVELWNPVTLETIKPDYRKVTEATTVVPVELAALESVFVIFNGKAEENKETKMEFVEYKTVQTLSTPWTVTFEQGHRGPEGTVKFDELTDWSKSSDERIKYFSGHATYVNEFNIDELPNGEVYIEIDKAMVMADVQLNNKSIGCLWTAPYRLPLGKALKKGKNVLQIEVVNNWANRLIGDSRLPEEQRMTRVTQNPYKPDSKLQESGLIGKVRIVIR